MKKIAHPHVIGIHDVIDDEEGGRLCLVMELVAGGVSSATAFEEDGRAVKHQPPTPPARRSRAQAMGVRADSGWGSRSSIRGF
jgi:hypothetical protein